MQTWHAGALIGVVMTTTVEAQSLEEGGVRLSWVRAEGAEACPSPDALEAEVVRRLHRDPFQEPVTQTIEGVVQRRAEGRWEAVLYDRAASGELVGARRLTSDQPDCESLASAVALAVALAIDPDAAMTAGSDAGGSDARDSVGEHASDVEVGPDEGFSPPETAAALDSDAERDRENARRPGSSPASSAAISAAHASESESTGAASDSERPGRRDSPSVRVHAGLHVAWQLVPGLAPALSFEVDARIVGPVRFVAGMLYVPEQRTAEPGADFGFGITAARVGACWRLEAERLSGGGCAAVSLGAIHAVVYQPRPVDPGDRFFGSVDLLADASMVLVEPLFVRVAAGLTVPLDRHRFRIEGSDSAEFQQPAAVPFGVFSAGVRFP